MKSTVYFTMQASPLGELTLAATDKGLCGLYFPSHQPAPKREGWKRDDGPRFDGARAWLENFFAGKKPGKLPKLAPLQGTPFQRCVWDALRSIPRGKTTTYGEIAREIGAEKAVRAVGAAVGRNPLSLFIPCHRVVGKNGSLTGYAGGVERKKRLLELEGIPASLS